jgi:CBS domain-containing protein
MKTVNDLPIKNFVSDAIIVTPLDSVTKAIGLMKERNSYEVLACVGNRVGMVTIRDLLRAKSLQDEKVETFLNYVPKLTVNASLFEAAKIMAEYRLRALPVAEDDEIIGKIDVKTIVNEVKDTNLGNLRASKIMTPSPATISCGEKVAKARMIMIRRKFDHLPVIRDSQIVGIVTSSQMVFGLTQGLAGGRYVFGAPDIVKPFNSAVEAMMEKDPFKCAPQDTVKQVSGDMLKRDFSYCLVTVGEELHGIITLRDFAKMVAQGEEKPDVPLYMTGLPDDPFEAEAAKLKFGRIVEHLRKVMPSIIEARSSIKTSGIQKQRNRYEVKVSINTPRENYSYTSEGWDLPDIFDELANSIKKMVASKQKRRRFDRRGSF